MMRFFGLCAVLIGCVLALSACHGPYKQRFFEKDLRDYSYDAADILIRYSRDEFAPNAPILVGTLNNVDQLEQSSTFGRIVAEQLAGRFAMRDFKVTELKLRNDVNIKSGMNDMSQGGEFLLSRHIEDIRGEHQAAIVVTGTYAVASSNVQVNLKMIEVASGRMIAGYDYELPLTADIDAMLYDNSGEARIFGKSMAY